MNVLDNNTCQSKLRLAKKPNRNSSLLGPAFKLHPSFLCAGGGEDQDTCTGDGGSPLVCPSADYTHYFQVSSCRKVTLFENNYYLYVLILHVQLNLTIMLTIFLYFYRWASCLGASGVKIETLEYTLM